MTFLFPNSGAEAKNTGGVICIPTKHAVVQSFLFAVEGERGETIDLRVSLEAQMDVWGQCGLTFQGTLYYKIVFVCRRPLKVN